MSSVTHSRVQWPVLINAAMNSLVSGSGKYFDQLSNCHPLKKHSASCRQCYVQIKLAPSRIVKCKIMLFTNIKQEIRTRNSRAQWLLCINTRRQVAVCEEAAQYVYVPVTRCDYLPCRRHLLIAFLCFTPDISQ